jgi:hypothetical protein
MGGAERGLVGAEATHDGGQMHRRQRPNRLTDAMKTYLLPAEWWPGWPPHYEQAGIWSRRAYGETRKDSEDS